MANSLSKDQFIERARKAHGSKYSYEKSIYVNMRKPISIICTIHGEFKQSPMNHLKTEGCPKCGYESRHKKPESVKEEIKFSIPNNESDDDEDSLLMNSVMTSFKKFHKDFKLHVNPLNTEPTAPLNRPVPKNKQQSIIPITTSMLEHADISGMIVYDDIDDDSLVDTVSWINGNADAKESKIKLIKRLEIADWNSIALNPTFTIGDLIFRKSMIDIEYLIHSPAFSVYAHSNQLTQKSGILTETEFVDMLKKYPAMMSSIQLADDWFDGEYNELLYNEYIIPSILNYGYTLSKKTLELFKTRIIEFCIRYITTTKDVVAMSKIPTLLSSLPEHIFMTVFIGLDGCVLRRKYLDQYMSSKYLSDASLDHLLNQFGDEFYKLISSTQVPSLKFIRKHRTQLDGILILRSMVRNNRIFNSYIEEFIDELLEYNKIRSKKFDNLHTMSFTGNDSNQPYIYSESGELGKLYEQYESPFGNPIIKNFSYLDKSGGVSADYTYYKEDIMKNIYLKTNNKIFKALYESLQLDNPKNNDMIASIQSELETLLNNSKLLQEKLTKFKRAI